MNSLKSIEIPRVVLGVPLASSMIYWRVVAGILGMEKPEDCDLMVFQGALVDRARNHIIEKMLEHPMEPTHLFFLDSDIVPEPDTLTKLLKVNRPIVSGLYRKRLPPYEPMAFVKSPPHSPSLKKRGLGGDLVPIALKGPRLRKVDVVGAGCLLIHREAFEKIPSPWFTSEWTDEGHLSEDFSFCEKARKVGYDITVETSVRLLHLEPMGVGTDAQGKVSFVPLD